jgi:hypothetical protein
MKEPNIGLDDQLKAAADEATNVLAYATAQRGGRGVILEGGPGTSIIFEILNRCVTVCDHLRSPQPAYVNWGKRAMCCLQCAPTFVDLPDVDPPTMCERCHTEPDDQQFSEFAYQVGPIIVSINVCTPCRKQVTNGEPVLTFD